MTERSPQVSKGSRVSLAVLPPKQGGILHAVLAWAARVYRVGVIVCIVWVIHMHSARLKVDGDAPIRVREVKSFLPSADSFATDASTRQGLFVLDPAGQRIGYVLRTSPMCDDVTGWSGPTDTMIVMDAKMRVVGVRIRSTQDTKEHIETIQEDENFLKLWNGKSWEEVAGFDPDEKNIEGVSGASMTSRSIALSISQRFYRPDAAAKVRPVPLKLRFDDWGLIAVIALAAVLMFFKPHENRWVRASCFVGLMAFLIYAAMQFVWWRGVTSVIAVGEQFNPWYARAGLVAVALLLSGWGCRKVRRSFQVVLVVYLGLMNGQLLAESLFAGWSASALVPWRTSPGLVLLAAAALIVPFATRRALYCSHICPHGAAQELLGTFTRGRLHLKLPRGVDAGLKFLPLGLLALILIYILLNLPTHLIGLTTKSDLSAFEPFEAYMIRVTGWALSATVIIALIGLITSVFVPMSYCKYGCPTGLVLKFVRSHGKADGFGKKEIAAGLLVVLAFVLSRNYMAIHDWIMK